MVPPLNAKTTDAILVHHQKGLSSRKIRKALIACGMIASTTAISRVIKDKRNADKGILKPPKRKPLPTKRTPEIISRVKDLIECPDPASVRTIAAQLGISNATVSRIIHEDLGSEHSRPKAEYTCQEDGCDFEHANVRPLRDHLRVAHEFPQFERFRLILPNKTLFEAWKKHMMDANRGIFHIRGGKCTRPDGSFINEFHCQRSFRSDASAYFRLSFRCTAQYKAHNRADGSVVLTGCLAHYGHDPTRDWNEEKADPNLHITMPADSASVYAGAFPLLGLAHHTKGEGGGMMETYLPLESQTTASNPQFPISWEYIPIPLVEERRKTLADVSSFVRAAISEMQMETTERALYDFEQVKKVLDSLGRMPRIPVLPETMAAASLLNPVQAPQPPAWMFMADGLDFSAAGEGLTASGLPVGDGELGEFSSGAGSSTSLPEKPNRLNKNPKKKRGRPNNVKKVKKQSKKTKTSCSRISPASVRDGRKSQDVYSPPAGLRPRRNKPRQTESLVSY